MKPSTQVHLAEEVTRLMWLLLPFVQDGTRRDAAFRQRQHAWYLDTLERAGVAYVILRGSVEERVGTALDVLASRKATAGS